MKNFKCVHSPIKECLQTCLTDWKPGFHVRQNLKYCSNLWLSMLLTSLVYTLAIFGVQCTRYCGHWAVLSCIKTRFCGFQLFLKWVCYFKWLVNLKSCPLSPPASNYSLIYPDCHHSFLWDKPFGSWPLIFNQSLSSVHPHFEYFLWRRLWYECWDHSLVTQLGVSSDAPYLPIQIGTTF